MKDLIYVGWNRTGTSDKIWAIFLVNERVANKHSVVREYITIHGRRGSKLRESPPFEWHCIDRYGHLYKYGEPATRIAKKEKSGYASVPLDQLTTVYPDFETDISTTAFYAKLKY